ncbi:kappa-type opioid receptor-like [Mytilus edulis]|uniref:kappa-type opioid receptor-like n=1 Tax=Mytilus edulis TaxID=6550 RepID=UPI0039EE7799
MDSVEHMHYTSYPEYKTGIYIWKILPPILIILGTTGNILSIIVLRRKNIQKSVCSIYLIVLSISDLFVLYTGLLRQWISVVFGVDIRNFGSNICKLHTYIVYFSLDFTSWILMAVTVQRVFLVCFPQKTKTKCTKREPGISLVAIAAFLLLINSHILYGYGDKESVVNGTVKVEKCSFMTDEYNQFWNSTWASIDLALFCGIPFCCLLIGNVLIFVKVLSIKRAVKRQVAPSTSTHGSRNNQKDSKLSSMSVMLFTLNSVFLVSTTPISIYMIGNATWEKELVGRDYAVLEMMWAIVNIFMYLNNSMNFLLYILSGSKFRHEFKEIFWRKSINKTPAIRNGSITRISPLQAIQLNKDETHITQEQICHTAV